MQWLKNFLDLENDTQLKGKKNNLKKWVPNNNQAYTWLLMSEAKKSFLFSSKSFYRLIIFPSSFFLNL